MVPDRCLRTIISNFPTRRGLTSIKTAAGMIDCTDTRLVFVVGVVVAVMVLVMVLVLVLVPVLVPVICQLWFCVLPGILALNFIAVTVLLLQLPLQNAVVLERLCLAGGTVAREIVVRRG